MAAEIKETNKFRGGGVNTAYFSSYQNTGKGGDWGGVPGNTSGYVFGAHQLFSHARFGALARGAPYASHPISSPRGRCALLLHLEVMADPHLLDALLNRRLVRVDRGRAALEHVARDAAPARKPRPGSALSIVPAPPLPRPGTHVRAGRLRGSADRSAG